MGSSQLSTKLLRSEERNKLLGRDVSQWDIGPDGLFDVREKRTAAQVFPKAELTRKLMRIAPVVSSSR